MRDPDRTIPPGSRPWSSPRILRLGLAGALVSALGASPASSDQAPDQIVVFAAASLSNALHDVATLFEDATGHQVTISAAGSAALARQITLGAPADLYVSADPVWVDTLEAADLTEPGQRVNLLTNRIVLIGHGADGPAEVPPSTLDLDEILGEGRLAIGLIDAVPAGRYGMAALQEAGLWATAQNRLAQTDNVRAALALVATGAAPAGIVYETDARAEPRVHVLSRFDPTTHPPIVYPLVDLSGTDGEAENALFEFLTGPEATAVFAAHGFGTQTGQGAP